MSLDERFMRIALTEAKKALPRGDFPVGACLVIEDKLFGKEGNRTKSSGNRLKHAELELITNYQAVIRYSSDKNMRIVIYTTLEPCLMCLGAAAISRVNEIVYACADPDGGATHLKPEEIAACYSKKWPMIRQCPFAKESFDLLSKFMSERKEWQDVLENFRKLPN